MKPFAFKKANIESRKHDVKILRGMLSSVIGLKFAGYDVSPFLCARTVHAFFHSAGISPETQIVLNTAVIYERRKGQRLKGMIDILSRGHGEPEAFIRLMVFVT